MVKVFRNLYIWFLALLAGAIQGFSFAPANQWSQIVAVALLFFLIWRSRGVWQPFFLGLCFGLAWFVVSISWTYVSIHYYGYVPSILSGIIVLAFAGVLALFPASASFLMKRLCSNDGRGTIFFLFCAPVSWALCEWLRSVVLSGFPWAASAYAHVDGFLRGYAPLCGTVGLNFIAAFCSGLLVLLLSNLLVRQTRSAIIFFSILVCVMGVGYGVYQIDWSKDFKDVEFRLVQGGVSQDEKFSPMGSEKTFNRYIKLVREPGLKGKGVIVLPETIFPVPVGKVPTVLWNRLIEVTKTAQRSLILGGFMQDGTDYVNSVLLIQKGELTGLYVKKHLVPFGEYVPFGFHWFVAMLGIPMGDLRAGSREQAPFEINGVSIAPVLCYEDLFGAEIRDWWQGKETPQVLMNLSNLGWFGDSLALPQHLNISRMRAIEFSRPVVRATNTGATAAIDHKGRVISQLPYMIPGKLDVSIKAQKGEATPYARLGDFPFVVFYLVILFVFGFKKQRRSNNSDA